MNDIILSENIVNKIYFFRGHKVMIDRDLAELYRVETRRLNEQVKRNIERFTDDFMFQLNDAEFKILMSQNATSSWGGTRKLPYAFTEHGILMLSNVLNSDRAISVSIQIIRVFTKLRQMLSTHEEFKKKIEDMEKKYDHQFKIVFDAIRKLITDDQNPKPKIGFERTKK